MDEPVTDVTFVSSVDNCPEGYTVITKCPCGHDAQLWEKILGGEAATRYLCFTKDRKNDHVIEDMYIPCKSEQYLRHGYHIVKETVEGKTPMYHRQLAVKSVPRTEAMKAVADVIVARSKDKISTIYTKTEKVNGLCICFRKMDYKYVPPPALAARRSTLAGGEKVQKRFEQTLDYGAGGADGGRDLGRRFEGLRVYDDKPLSRQRAASEYAPSKGRQFKVNLDSYAPSPPESPGIIDGEAPPPYSETVDSAQQQAYRVHLTDYSPSPAFTGNPEKPVYPVETSSESTSTVPLTKSEEVAAVKMSYSLGSAPPPSSDIPGQTPPTHHTSSSSTYPPPPDAAPATTFNPHPTSYQPSPGKFQHYPPQSYPSSPSTTDIPPSTIAPSIPAGGPSFTSYAPVQAGAYQSAQYTPPSLTTAPPPAYSAGIGFTVGGAPYAVPPQPGYQSVAGNAFGQSGYSSNVGVGGPAPYNPYHHQQTGVGGYPPPPAPPGQSQQNQSASYGFKF